MPEKVRILHINVELTPKESYSDLDENIMNKLNNLVLNKCITEGYISKIERIVRRGKGLISGTNFDGNITYNIWYVFIILQIRYIFILK